MNDCKTKYEEILKKNKIFSFEDINIICSNNYSSCENVYDDSDVCCKSLKKANKDKYYIHTYNRDWVPELLKTNTELNDELINYMFNLEEKNNCCNCIAIVLYAKNNIEKLYDYLYSIKKSLDNVSNILNDFIVRFYLDESVFKTIYSEYSKYKEQNLFYNNGELINKETDDINLKYLTKSFEMLKYIINHEQSEIYIYFCKNIIETNNLEKVRSFRFLPLIEEDVNIIIVREADGFVSYTDCHNIRIFSKNEEHKILMTYDLVKNFYLDKKNNHYSSWLNSYDLIDDIYMFCKTDNSIIFKYIINNLNNEKLKYNEHFNELEANKNNEEYKRNLLDKINYSDYFLNKDKYSKRFKIDILAGIFASKVMFNRTYYIEINKLIKNSIIEYSEYDELNKYITQSIAFITSKYKISKDDVLELLKIGYDEILLFKLYYPLITTETSKINNLIVLIKDTTNKMLYLKLNDETKFQDKQNDIFNINTNDFFSRDEFDDYFNEYYSDMIFSKDFKIKENSAYNNNNYLGYNIELLNKTFKYSIVYDKYYSLIYPENTILTGGNKNIYFNKYLKYKKKYLKLKEK